MGRPLTVFTSQPGGSFSPSSVRSCSFPLCVRARSARAGACAGETSRPLVVRTRPLPAPPATTVLATTVAVGLGMETWNVAPAATPAGTWTS